MNQLKSLFLITLAILAFAVAPSNVYGQCANDNNFWQAVTSFPCGSDGQITIGAGTYATFPVINNVTYVFRTCGSTPITGNTFDTQLTGFNGSSSTVAFFNDDRGGSCTNCSSSVCTDPGVTSTESYVQWTSNFTGTLRVNVDRFNCDACAGGQFGTNCPGLGSAALRYTQVNNLTFTSSAATMCSGETRTLTATPAGGAFTGTGVSSGVFTAPTTAGNYTITYALGACSVTQVIVVKSASTAPTGINASATSFCQVAGGPNTVTLTVAGGALGTNATWRWYSGSCGGTAVGTGPSIVVTPPVGTTNYYVRAEGDCNNTACATVAVTVKTPSTDPNSISISNNNFCPGGNSVLTVQGGSLGTNAQFVWYSGASCCGTVAGTGSSITVTPSATTIYYVRAEGDCGNTNNVSATVTVKVASTAPGAITSTNGTQFCSGTASTSLSFTGGSLGTNAQYRWYSGSCGGTLVGSGPTLNVNPTSTTSYFVRAEGDCGNTACSSVTINVSSGLAITGFNNTNVTCAGGANGTSTPTVTGGLNNFAPFPAQTVSSTGLTGPTFPSLSGGALTGSPDDIGNCCRPGTASSPTNIIPFTVNITGAYTITNQYTGGMDGYLLLYDNTYDVSQNPPAGFITGNDDCTNSSNSCVTAGLTAGQTYYLVTTNFAGVSNAAFTTTFAGPGQAGSTGYTYRWSNGQTTATATGLTAGSYNVTVFDAAGCSVTSSTNITQGLGITISNVTSTNITCNGANNGTITISATGGSGTLQYSVDNGANYQVSNSFTGLAPGTYNVIVKDNGGCPTSYGTPIVLTDPAVLNISIDSTKNASCNGVNNGTIYASGSGGTGTLQFSLNGSPLQPGGTFSNLSAGNYSVLIQDANGCSTSALAVINNSAGVVIALDSTKNVTCNGLSNGAIFVSASNGTTPYSYTINGLTYQPTGTFTGLTGGNYTVLVRDAAGCSDNLVASIVEPSPLTLTVDSVHAITCGGNNSGEVFVSTTGGTIGSGYTYIWSNGATTEDLSGVAAGTYYVTATDANGCSTIATATVTQPQPLFVSLASPARVNCFGDSTGTVDINVYGGVAPYSYIWSNGDTLQDATLLAAGTYTVTVTDANGCQDVSSFTVTQPAAALALSAAVTDVTCTGANTGAIDLTVTGGSTPYTYSWSNGATTEDLTGLSAGTYTVQVRDNNGCTKSSTYILGGAAVLTATVDSIHNLSCFGSNNGGIYVTTVGGGGTYTYTWSNGATTEDLTGVAAGTYTLTISDGSCQVVLHATITSPTALVVTTTVTDVNCNGGSDGTITTSVTGGTGPYTYLWSNGATTASLTGLTTNIYSVQVTDANGCTVATAATVNEPAQFGGGASVVNVTCNGQSNGAIFLTVGGATPPYSYLWSNFATTQNITGLTAGTYSVTVLDAHSCSITSSFTVTEPNALTLTVTATDANCNGASNGAVTSTVGGGTTPYTYLWNNGQTTSNLSNVAAGIYTLRVSDANGCTVAATDTVGQPAAIALSSSIINVGCNGGATGSLSVTATGGTGPYNFSWSSGQVNNGVSNSTLTGLNAGTYTVTVSDANGCSTVQSFTITQPAAITLTAQVTNLTCNGSSNGAIDLSVAGGSAPYFYLWTGGATTQDLTNIPAGTYTVNVTDNAGCTSTLTVVVTEPSVLAVQASTVNVTCNGSSNGAIYLTTNGGTAPYTYNWSNAATTQNLVNQTAGTYSVTVTDAHGCSIVQSYTITQPNALTVTLASTNIGCFGQSTGSITSTVAGGTGTYTYLWNNGATTANLSGLPAGTYTVQVTDANGCNAVSSTTLTQNPEIIVTDTITQIACNGGTGSIALGVTGGVTPYTYTWSNGATTSSITNLTAATYTVTVSDNAGCSKTLSYTLTQPTALAITDSVTNVRCNGSHNGSILVEVSGGTQPYTYLWSDGVTIPNRLGLGAGIYSLTATDAHNCTITLTDTVTQPDTLATLVTGNDASCAGFSDGNAFLTVTGGTQPYSYFWSNFSFSQNLTNITVGKYTVLVTDANGCTKVDSITIGQPAPLVLSLDPVVAGCGNDSLGQVISSVQGGTQPYHYFWSTGDTTRNISGLHAGTYSVTITDGHGCSISGTAVVASNPLPVASFTFNVACAGTATNFINTSGVSAGTLTYAWNFGDGDTSTQRDPAHTFASAGTYQVKLNIVTDKGCTDSTTQQVDVNALPVASISANGDTSGRVCAADSVTLSVPDSLSTVYEWSTGATTPSILATQSGQYIVTVTNVSGCAITDTVNVSLYNSADVTVTHDTTISLGFSVQLVATGGNAYLWAPSTGLSDSTIANPIASPTVTTTYLVTISPDSACSATRRVTVTVVEDFLVQSPNVFTPNGDGIHDKWIINNIENYPVCKVEVYNRWGSEVFSAAPYNNDWDGTKGGVALPDGTYYYVIKCNDKVYSGSITIVR